MAAIVEKPVEDVATVSIGNQPMLATYVVLAVNPTCPPDRTATFASQAATWSNRPTPIDGEPTWEDAAWQ